MADHKDLNEPVWLNDEDPSPSAYEDAPQRHTESNRYTEIEQRLLGALLLRPDRIDDAHDIQPADFYTPQLAQVYTTLRKHAANGIADEQGTIDLGLFARRLEEAHGEGPWNVTVAELVDAEVTTAAPIRTYVEELKRDSLGRRLVKELGQALQDNDWLHRHETLEEVARLHQQIQDIGAHRDLGGLPVMLTADDHATLPIPPQNMLVPNLILGGGHLSVLIGKPMSGKTTLAGCVAIASALGESPWPSAPRMPKGRVLWISPDAAYGEIRAKLRRMAIGQFKMNPECWHHGIDILAKYHHPEHPEKSTLDYLSQLCLDDQGFTDIERTLEAARIGCNPYSGIVLDCYAHFLPPGVAENDNETATQILGRLESLCVGQGEDFWGLLLHHSGHSDSERQQDPKAAARGASAFAATARSAATLYEGRESACTRLLSHRSNEGDPQDPILLEVAPEGSREGEIVYFKPADFGDGMDLIDSDEWVSISELARRLQIKVTGIDPGSKSDPHGGYKREARKLVSQWNALGLIEQRSGARGAKECRLK